MRNILYSIVALCIIVTISACGGSNSTSQTNPQVSVALHTDKSVVVADGTDGVTLTATVTDSTGSLLSGQEVLLNVPPTLTFSNLPAAPLITDDNGQVVLFLRPMYHPQNDAPVLIPTDDITVICLGVISSPIRLTINPGPSQITSTVTITAGKVQAIADGSDPVTFTATVKDVNGNPIAGQLISFRYEPFPLQRYTDSNGKAVFIMTRPPFLQRAPTTIISMTATSGGVTSNIVDVTYTVATPSQVTLTADKSQAIADGVEKISFTATVKDKNGSPIPYQSIIFDVSPGANRYISPIVTDINGTAVMQLTVPPSSAQEAITSVSATSGSITSNTVNVTFTSPPQVTPNLVTLTSNKTTLIANGSDQVTFTITATNASGNPLVGQLVHLNLPYGPYISLTQQYTNTAGKASSTIGRYINSTWPAPTTQTTVAITATVNGANSNVVNITVKPP